MVSLLDHYGGLGLGLHRLDIGVATWGLDHDREAGESGSGSGSESQTESKSESETEGARGGSGGGESEAAFRARWSRFSWDALNGGKAFEHIGWHPGPGNHRLRGLLLAHAYMTAALQAAEALAAHDRDNGNKGTAATRRPGSSSAIVAIALQHGAPPSKGGARGAPLPPPVPPPPLPPPLLCAEWLCAEEAHCASSYLPRADYRQGGDGGGSDGVGDDGESPSPGGLAALSPDRSLWAMPAMSLEAADRARRGSRGKGFSGRFGDGAPDGSGGGGGGGGGDFEGGGKNQWSHEVFAKTWAALRKAMEQRRGYLDRKLVLQSPRRPSTAEAAGKGRQPESYAKYWLSPPAAAAASAGAHAATEAHSPPFPLHEVELEVELEVEFDEALHQPGNPWTAGSPSPGGARA